MGHDTGPRFWQNRKECCFTAIERRDPDVICLQECHTDQLADFKVRFPGHDCIHGNSAASEQFPENAIFYRSFIQAFRQLSLPLGFLSGVIFLHEKNSVTKTAGLILILGGLLIVSFFK